MTDFSLNYTAFLDTWPLRQAIWFFMLKACRLARADYDYDRLPYYLNEELTAYLTKAVNRPHEIDSRDFGCFGYDLRCDEKVHINILIAESACQARLTKALWCIAQHVES